MRVEFESPAPVRTSDAERRVPSVIEIIVGVLLIAVVSAGAVLAVGSSGDAPVEDAASRAGIPYSEEDSVAACGRRGVGISACLESEANLRVKAQALWDARPVDVRRECLRDAGSREPVGRLYTCLAITKVPTAAR
jgi:hypothetical protein